MKVLVIILLTVISMPFAHSAKVLVDGLNVSTELCCGNTCDPGETDEEDVPGECNGKLCNPFHACGSCVLLFNGQNQNFSQTDLFSGNTAVFYDTGFYKLLLTHDFWQPPKLSC